MEQDMGASLRDRATAAEPVVSALRDGIPSAGECWFSKVPDTDIYALVGPDGHDIGFVRKFYRTIEKEIPGKRYVAWRRTAKTPSWRYWLKGEREPGGRYAVSADTRQRAAERLLSDCARDYPDGGR